MASDPVRVLHVFGMLGLGGAETRTMDLYRNIDRNRVQFDFLVHTDRPSYYDEAARELGAGLYRLPRFTGNNLVAYRGAARELFRENAHKWRVVQGHMTSTAAVYLPFAKQYGAALTIAHARSAGVEPGLKGIATKVFEYPLRSMKAVDARLAVSREAGEAVFGKEAVRRGRVKVVANAIDTARFAFDPDLRAKTRAVLGIPQNALVAGHVGRFHYAKNHEYLLKVFAEVRKAAMPEVQKRLKLLLIGDGERMADMRALAERKGIVKDVLFAGSRSDVSACYQAMDVFVYPSRYEGMPGVVIEAQASGLRCLISDAITQEADVTELVGRMSVSRPPEYWAREVTAALLTEHRRAEQSANAREALARAGFDVREQAREMTRFYLGETETATEQTA